MPGFSEALTEQIQAAAILVIHPGSRFLRIGRAADLSPLTILHAIARRRKEGGKHYCDKLLPSVAKLDKDMQAETENCTEQLQNVLMSCLTSSGSRRTVTPLKQIIALNIKVEGSGSQSNSNYLNVKDHVEYVVGDEALLVNPNEKSGKYSGWNVHFPMRRGKLNIHSDVGGSLSSVLVDMETIWSHCISEKLKIPLKDLKHYRAVLVIPVIYNRTHIKGMIHILLNQLKFGGCFLIQNSVAATFGAGIATACVVDVGDGKVSVSCVDDGLSQPETRLRLEYGGGDITQVFHWLMKRAGFPYKSCSPETKYFDSILLTSLKENLCHVNLDVCGVQEREFEVCDPEGQHNIKYQFHTGDECIMGPLAFFQTELCHITGPKKMVLHTYNKGDPEDPHDDNYLRETSRRGMKDAGDTGPSADPSNPDCDGNQDEEMSAIDFELTSGSMVGRDHEITCDKLLSIDQAILQSIDRCGSDDLKRKMYSCILVVGGGMNFQGIGTWLQNRLALQIPYAYRPEQMDIITRPKEMDPAMIAWKGASIMSCLETAQELWINAREWNSNSVKILREKAPFVW